MPFKTFIKPTAVALPPGMSIGALALARNGDLCATFTGRFRADEREWTPC